MKMKIKKLATVQMGYSPEFATFGKIVSGKNLTLYYKVI